MRRFTRHILNGITTVLSLSLIAIVILWVRSHWRVDRVQHSRHDEASRRTTVLHVRSENGYVVFTRIHSPPSGRDEFTFWSIDDGFRASKAPSGELPQSLLISGGNSVERTGPIWHRSSRYAFDEGTVRETLVPHWLFAVLAAVSPLVWIAGRWMRRSRYSNGLCPACGYDLRASPDRCPECGTEMKQDQPQMNTDARR